MPLVSILVIAFLAALAAPVFVEGGIDGDARFQLEYAGQRPGSMQSLIDQTQFAGGAVPRKFPGTYLTRLQAKLAPGDMGSDLVLRRAASDSGYRRAIWW
jgi:hypothetical protein